MESLNEDREAIVVSSGKYPLLDISIANSPPDGILFSTVRFILADCSVDLILFLLLWLISLTGVFVTEINVIGAIITSKGASRRYLPPILIPASSVPRPSILTREFTLNETGLDDIRFTIVVSPVLGGVVVLST